MTGHGVSSTKKVGKVHTVTCACGEHFDSLESEALARTYLDTHIRIAEKRGVDA